MFIYSAAINPPAKPVFLCSLDIPPWGCSQGMGPSPMKTQGLEALLPMFWPWLHQVVQPPPWTHSLLLAVWLCLYLLPVL